MGLFKEIVKSVLLEDVQIGKVNDAITRKYEVKINYHSDTDSASGERIIQPVAYGVTKAGNLVLRAYQPFGDTQTNVPSWKLFSLSGIKKWKPLQNRIFTAPEGFNPNGDKSMSIVYTIANFEKTSSKKTSEQPKPIKTNGQITNASLMNNFKKNEVNQKKPDKKLDNLDSYSDIIKDKINNTIQNKGVNSHMVAGSGPVTKNSIQTNVNTPQENNIFKKD